jgi:hypothetical protein
MVKTTAKAKVTFTMYLLMRQEAMRMCRAVELRLQHSDLCTSYRRVVRFVPEEDSGAPCVGGWEHRSTRAPEHRSTPEAVGTLCN